MTAEQQLERSVLERKEREELRAIAQAMSLDTNSRSKKADIIDQILRAAGVEVTEASANGGSAAPARARASSRSAAADADADADDIVELGVDATNGSGRASTNGNSTSAASGTFSPTSSGGSQVDTVAPSGDAGESGETDAHSPDGQPSTERDDAGPSADRAPAGPVPPVCSNQNPEPPAHAAGWGQCQRTRQPPGSSSSGPRGGRPGPVVASARIQGGGQEAQYSGELIPVSGLLDLRDEGYGFLRADGYLPRLQGSSTFRSARARCDSPWRRGDSLSRARAARRRRTRSSLRSSASTP